MDCNGLAGSWLGRCGPGRVFGGEVSLEVDLGRLDVFVTEPEGDHRGVYALRLSSSMALEWRRT